LLEVPPFATLSDGVLAKKFRIDPFPFEAEGESALLSFFGVARAMLEAYHCQRWSMCNQEMQDQKVFKSESSQLVRWRSETVTYRRATRVLRNASLQTAEIQIAGVLSLLSLKADNDRGPG
jgi:hypothetical protein